MPSKDQIAALAEFVASIGLRLSEHLDREREATLDRLIAWKAALGGRIELEDYVTTRITRSGGTATMSRVQVVGLKTTACEAATTNLVWELRSCRLIAVGKAIPDIPDVRAPRYDTERPLQLILPHQWDDEWGDLRVVSDSDIVSSDDAAYQDVRVASVAQLDATQMARLQQVIAKSAVARSRARGPVVKRDRGRPTLKVLILRILVDRWCNDLLEDKVSAEARAIEKILHDTVHGEAIPKADSIETRIRVPYRHLKKLRKGVKFLSGRI